MKIESVDIENYRSIEKLTVSFDSIYTAVCGRNNAGKSNIVRALRTVFDGGEGRTPFAEKYQINYSQDFPVWKKSELGKQSIKISVHLRLSRLGDAGLMNLIEKYHSKKIDKNDPELVLIREYLDSGQASTKIEIDGESLVKDADVIDVYQKLSTSQLIIYHNSTEHNRSYFYGETAPFMSGLSGEDRLAMADINKYMGRQLKRVAKKHQENLTELLQKLTNKHKVGLRIPPLDLNFLPFQLSLSDQDADIALDDWGSGTKNQTLILVSLFKASVECRSNDPARITPLVIVEEPECFLHPSAQAEFGRVLQELAQEQQVQVVVTTHSPYLLSQKSPDCNKLISRRSVYKKPRETYVEDTAGDQWMQPFGEALGVNSDEFRPWKNAFFSSTADILLVEGAIDKEYLELLKDAAHGKNKLLFEGEIFPYGGKDTLKNTVLLRFIKNRYRRYFVTFDLDALDDVKRSLEALDMVKGQNYLPVGKVATGKDRIEGLLPENIISTVRAHNAALVDQAIDGTGDEKRSAKQKLKEKYYEEFRKTARIANGDFKEFYPLVSAINKVLAKV